jgi:hypothetical protein
MTNIEFNNKYKDYLKDGFYGLSINIPELTKYLDEQFQEYIKKPDFVFYQIKSKFGFFKIYCDNLSENEIKILERTSQLVLDKYNNEKKYESVV